MESKIIIVMFAVSIFLFILSFLKKDRMKQVETQIENMSITLMQEIYQLKKKIKVLEEEIIINSDDTYFDKGAKVDQKVEDKIIQFYEEGYSLLDIAEMTSVPSEVVEDFLTSYIRGTKRKGGDHV